MNNGVRIAYILLAAGNSSRFGGCKQLAKINSKKTLLEHSLDTALELTSSELNLVLGAQRVVITASLAQKSYASRLRIIINEQWHEGMGRSIAAAMNDILKPGALDPCPYEAVMILLADQIAIQTSQLEQMREIWCESQHKIVASLYDGSLGAPAIFPKTFFAGLAELTGDRGAKAILRQESAQVLPFSLAEAQIDIDTKQQLRRWQRGINKGIY